MIPFHAMKNFALILMFMLTASIAFATSSTSKENQPDLKTKITELESKIAELETKLKVQASIQGEQVRVSGKSKDCVMFINITTGNSNPLLW